MQPCQAAAINRGFGVAFTGYTNFWLSYLMSSLDIHIPTIVWFKLLPGSKIEYPTMM